MADLSKMSDEELISTVKVKTALVNNEKDGGALVRKLWDELSSRIAKLRSENQRMREAITHLVHDRSGMTSRPSIDTAIVSFKRLCDLESALSQPEGAK